jgi:two-component system response regulator RegA
VSAFDVELEKDVLSACMKDPTFMRAAAPVLREHLFSSTHFAWIWRVLAEAFEALKTSVPAIAVLDMRLEDGNGLKVVEAIRDRREDARIIMLTGYGAIATAVAAVKAGAVDYLQKPADADDVVKALLATGEAPEPPENPMSADRVRWEHIQRVYELCDHNVSETARRLGMHRRTLQRILAKRAPR